MSNEPDFFEAIARALHDAYERLAPLYDPEEEHFDDDDGPIEWDELRPWLRELQVAVVREVIGPLLSLRTGEPPEPRPRATGGLVMGRTWEPHILAPASARKLAGVVYGYWAGGNRHDLAERYGVSLDAVNRAIGRFERRYNVLTQRYDATANVRQLAVACSIIAFTRGEELPARFHRRRQWDALLEARDAKLADARARWEASLPPEPYADDDPLAFEDIWPPALWRIKFVRYENHAGAYTEVESVNPWGAKEAVRMLFGNPRITEVERIR